MHYASSSVGALAAALAKAQAELVNPEKSLIGSLGPSESGGPERTFRYAPLAVGLDIIRKGLGQHEIATIQTTSIDAGAGLVRLTTVLAHSDQRNGRPASTGHRPYLRAAICAVHARWYRR
jgi:hypothetical protein